MTRLLESSTAVCAFCLALLLPLIISGGILAQSPGSQAIEKSCRQHPRLIGKCFTVRGRLSIYNGAPALRIWRVGTQRILGISEQRFAVAGYRNVPAEIEKQLNQDNLLFGDFLVCPFTPSRPREMQLVCVESARNITIREQRH